MVPVAVALVLALLPAPSGLAQHAWYFFAIFVGVIVGLVLEPLPGAAIALIGLTLITVLARFVLFGPEQLSEAGFRLPNAALTWALSGYSNSTVWLIFGAFIIVGAGNAVNLTDGLDGLAIVPVMIAAMSFGMIAYLTGNAVFSDYLQINYVAGTGELAVLCGAVLGAGLGFLWFNAPPASIFMGDTGSLALGGMLGSIAVAVKHEIVLAVIGGLFVLEAVSVIVQVVSFKLTGKRVFRMAPLHHHFEQKGWTEPQIVIRFWIISVMLALAGLSTLKLR